MNNIKVIIEQANKNYSAYLDGVDGIVTTGSSVEEIKTNMYKAIQAFIDECNELGREIPKELQGEFNLVFTPEIIRL